MLPTAKRRSEILSGTQNSGYLGGNDAGSSGPTFRGQRNDSVAPIN